MFHKGPVALENVDHLPLHEGNAPKAGVKPSGPLGQALQ